MMGQEPSEVLNGGGRARSCWKLEAHMFVNHRDVCYSTRILKVQSFRKGLQMIVCEAGINELHRRRKS
jgi:hypothetical protein